MFINTHDALKGSARPAALTAIAVAIALGNAPALAEEAETGASLTGYLENATYFRRDVGMSKMRNTVQFTGTRELGARNGFSNVTLVGTFRGSYDAVYDLNDSEYGDDAGGAINLQSVAGSGWTAWGNGDVSTGTLGFGFDTVANPNEGLALLGAPLHGSVGGVGMGVPVRPCDKDSRGCLDGYLDFTEAELKSPEFNDRLDFIREAYVDATTEPAADGSHWNFRVGRQQVVWGKSEPFRVLDMLNPVDYSRNNIYDQLKDIRIPMWMATAKYATGGTETFDDLNLQFVLNFDKFRPHNLGQSGSPNQILGAGSFFRAMKNCWDNGCTVANFANGNLSTDFPAHVIGIRDVHLPSWGDSAQFGMQLDGNYHGLGFSLNALSYRSQLPSLRGTVDNADNPFTVAVESQSWDYLIAFDMYFPRVTMIGGSLDYTFESIGSNVTLEAAYYQGEEFTNTLRPDLYSENDVFRYVLGWTRPTMIPFLKSDKPFILAGRLYGQYIVDHELTDVNGISAGIPDWELNHIGLFLMKGWYKGGSVSPQLILAHDFRANSHVAAPSVEWQVNKQLNLTFGANIKWGEGARAFDDCRSCNPFPGVPGTGPAGSAAGDLALRTLAGFEPAGRFRSGIIGMAEEEDEVQVTLRYTF